MLGMETDKSSDLLAEMLNKFGWLWLQNSRAPGTIVHGMRKDPQATGPLHGGVTIGRLMAGVDYSRPLRPKWSGTAGISFQVRVSFLVKSLIDSFQLVLVSVISIKLLHRNLMFWANTNSFPASWSSR